MKHFGIGIKRDGSKVFIEKPKEELLKDMNEYSNKGSEEFEFIYLFAMSGKQTKRKFKLPVKTDEPKKKRGRPPVNG